LAERKIEEKIVKKFTPGPSSVGQQFNRLKKIKANFDYHFQIANQEILSHYYPSSAKSRRGYPPSTRSYVSFLSENLSVVKRKKLLFKIFNSLAGK